MSWYTPTHSQSLDSQFQLSLIRAINEASPDGILVVDEHNIVVSHNQRFLEIWRLDEDNEAVGDTGSAVGSSDRPLLARVVSKVKDPDAFLKRVQELYANPRLDDHCEIELTDGRTLERHSTVLRGESSKYLGRVWFFRDISPRRAVEAELRNLAERDPLTGVANRRFFLTRAAQELARERRYSAALSLISIDIDHFKHVNDSYGHATGDEVLIGICTLCGTLLREVDVFGRLGGEEFAVLLPDTDLTGALVIAERLRQRVADDGVETTHGLLHCTISIGVTALLATDASIDDALRRADDALYRAKHAGRNRVETSA